MTTAYELRQFILDNYLFGQAAFTLSDDTSFLENGIIDSTGLLELIAFLEKKYGIRLEDQEIIPDNLDSIAKLTQFIQQKLSSSVDQPV